MISFNSFLMNIYNVYLYVFIYICMFMVHLYIYTHMRFVELFYFS